MDRIYTDEIRSLSVDILTLIEAKIELKTIERIQLEIFDQAILNILLSYESC